MKPTNNSLYCYMCHYTKFCSWSFWIPF